MRYDIALPFYQGRVEIDGVTLKPTTLPSTLQAEEPRYKSGDFHVTELNVAFWLPAIDAGWELVGLPVFIKRKPIYQYLFVRTDAGIDSPRDLAGKRIGCRQYALSTIWLRGLLKHRHGVDLSTATWVVWNPDVFPVHDPKVRIEPPPDRKKSVVDALLDGEIDVHMADVSDAQLFQRLETSDKVKRLFPNYAAEHERLYQETGIFTHSHLIVMSKKLDRERPELGCALVEAFDRAKQLAYTDILGDQAGFSILFLRERMKEQQAKWGDPWRNGVRANRAEIDAFVDYNYEQGLTRQRLVDAQIFSQSTLDT
jgi:4,5-dihydroxyphthalate decarboxylase